MTVCSAALAVSIVQHTTCMPASVVPSYWILLAVARPGVSSNIEDGAINQTSTELFL